MAKIFDLIDSVSISEEKCGRPSNNVRVFYDIPTNSSGQKDFIVCVKSVDFMYADVSRRLVEWVELLQILGADQIWLYKTQVHENIAKVFDYYSEKGVMTVNEHWKFPGFAANLPILKHVLRLANYYDTSFESYFYNDCVLRNMYKYKYAVVLDTDEIIIPVNSKSWKAMLGKLRKKLGAEDFKKTFSITYRQALFLDWMLEVKTKWQC